MVSMGSKVLLMMFIGAALAAPSSNQVLILSSTISSGLGGEAGGSYESAAVLALGLVPTVVTPTQWANMTAAQFGSYRAIVLGDPDCTTNLGLYSAASNNANLWMPQVTGNVVIVGTDPVFHSLSGVPGAKTVTNNMVEFAASDPTKVGAYICLSCLYDGTAVLTPVPLLAPLGVFTARGVSCDNNVHIVAVNPALAGLTDAALSGWSCSIHNGFDTFPATFVPLAIGLSLTGSGLLTFADGTVGVPYILARGAVPVLCGDGVIESPEQCDNGGANNGVLGNPCSSTCHLHWCGDGIVDPAEQCDLGARNGVAGSGCSATCTVTGPTCLPTCGSHGTCVFGSDGYSTLCQCGTGYSGSDCQCTVPSYQLSTDYPPILDVSKSGFLVKDALTLVLNVSSKYYNTQVTFRNEKNSSCNFPASSSVNYWQSKYVGVPGCLYVLTATIPWGVAWSSCLFQRDETTNYITFTGEMDVQMTESIGSIRNISLSRTENHILPFQVVFPKYVTVTSNPVTIFSNYSVQAAIVQQSFSSVSPPNGQAFIRLYTSVQWPYALQGPLNVSYPTGLPTTVSGPESAGPTECLNDGSSACQQWFDFVITPDVTKCTLNGGYTFSFFIGCNPSLPSGNCPLLTAAKGSIFYTLQSSYLCEQVVANVDLTATMTSSSTSTISDTKQDFTVGLTCYHLVQTSSTMVTIIDTYIDQVVAISPNGTTITLFDSSVSGNTAAGNALSLAIINDWPGHGTAANDAVFSMVFSPSYFNLAADAYAAWTFGATVNAEFYNTEPAPASADDADGEPRAPPIILTRQVKVTWKNGADIPAKEQAVMLANTIKFLASDNTDSTDSTGRDLSAQNTIIVLGTNEPSTTSAANTNQPVATAIILATATLAAALL
jgi:cysteine-rich repeat protein